MKKYILYAGVNGAGKTTLYRAQSEYHDLPRVNADEILAEFGDWRNPVDVLKAGKIAVKRLRELLSTEQSLVQETTLCGRSIIQTIINAKNKGYKIIVFYVSVDSVETAKKRVAFRVQSGGHGIPDADVEKRFCESAENIKLIEPYCDEIYFFDNTQNFRLITEIKN